MMIDLNIKTKPRLSANIQALAARGLISIEKRDWKNIYTINKVDSIYGPKAKATWPKRADYVEALKKQDEISAARKANKEEKEREANVGVARPDNSELPALITPVARPDNSELPALITKEDEAKKMNQEDESEEDESPASSPLPAAVALGGILPPDSVEIVLKLDEAQLLGRKWLEACLRRSSKIGGEPGWSHEKATKALEKELKWIRKNFKGGQHFSWMDLERALDFIDEVPYLALNIRNPNKLSDKWKRGRVMQVILDDKEASSGNKFMRMAKNAAEDLMDYNPDDWTTEGILRRARNGN